MRSVVIVDDPIPAGVAFDKGCWRVAFRVYLGCYLDVAQAVGVRRYLEQHCRHTTRADIKGRFAAMVAAGELPAPLVKGSCNTRRAGVARGR